VTPSERLREISWNVANQIADGIIQRLSNHHLVDIVCKVLTSETQRAREEAIKECADLFMTMDIYIHDKILSLLSPKESEKKDGGHPNEIR